MGGIAATLIRLVTPPTVRAGVVKAAAEPESDTARTASLMLEDAVEMSASGVTADTSSLALLTETWEVAGGNEPAPKTKAPPLTVVAFG